MTEEKVRALSERLTKPTSQNFVNALQNDFAKAGDRLYDALMNENYKSSTAALLFAIFLGNFGVHRFYLGNTALGIARIICFVVSIILEVLIPILGLIFGIVILIWHWADVYMAYKEAKNINETKVNKRVAEEREMAYRIEKIKQDKKQNGDKIN